MKRATNALKSLYSHFSPNNYLNLIETAFAFPLCFMFCGTVLYVIINKTLGIPHPGSIVLIVAALIGLLKIYCRSFIKTLSYNDLFLALIFFYIFLRGSPVPMGMTLALTLFLKFAILPYFLAKNLNKNTNHFFIILFNFVALALAVLTLFTLLSSSAQQLQSDRPFLFDFNRSQGLLSIIFGAAAVCVNLYQNLKNYSFKHPIFYAFILLQGLYLFLISFLQARGAFVALGITLFIVFLYFKKNSITKRLAPLSFLIVVYIFSNVLMTSNQLSLQKQLFTTESYSLNTELSPLEEKQQKHLASNKTLFETPIETCKKIPGNSITIRVFLYQSALRLFFENPLLGQGVKAYSIANTCVALQQYGVPHNLTLHILSELGFIGFILFALFAFTSIKTPIAYLFHARSQNPMSHDTTMLAILFLGLFFLINFQFAGCSYLECTELYILFAIIGNYKL